MVSPPLDAIQGALQGTPPNRQTGAGTAPDPRTDAAVPAPIAVDRADIRPLDLTGALQILVAEVRAELTAVLLQAGTDTAPAGSNSLPSAEVAGPSGALLPAARDILETAMNSLPQSSPQVAVWSDRLPAVERAVEIGMARAMDVIGNWRNVPAAIVDSAEELRGWVANALSDAPLNPVWLRPEWLNLAPQLLRMRRRRKFLQRRLTDPDFRPSFFDDPELLP